MAGVEITGLWLRLPVWQHRSVPGLQLGDLLFMPVRESHHEQLTYAVALRAVHEPVPIGRWLRVIVNNAFGRYRELLGFAVEGNAKQLNSVAYPAGVKNRL